MLWRNVGKVHNRMKGSLPSVHSRSARLCASNQVTFHGEAAGQATSELFSLPPVMIYPICIESRGPDKPRIVNQLS